MVEVRGQYTSTAETSLTLNFPTEKLAEIAKLTLWTEADSLPEGVGVGVTTGEDRKTIELVFHPDNWQTIRTAYIEMLAKGGLQESVEESE